MKTKHARPILIPQSKATWPNCMWLGRISGRLRLDTSYNDNAKSIDPIDNSMSPQELILISLEDEKIEESDWYCYLSYKGDYKLKQYNEEKHFNEDPCITLANLKAKKVIARQSQISPEYISKFIEQYNNGNVEDLEIEMEFTRQLLAHNNILEGEEPKLTNGFITIVKKLDIEKQADLVEAIGFKNLKIKEPINYTERDLRDAWSANGCGRWDSFEDWFEQNKKK